MRGIFSMAYNRNFESISQTSAKLVLHIFQGLNKHHLRFPALVWLHKQLSSTTSFCLPLVDCHYLVKELRILFQPGISPPVQAHHIIQLSVRFWMQHIQITCYRIQRRGGGGEQHKYAVGLESRARVPWALAARQSHSLQMSWTLSYSCGCPEDTNLKPNLCFFSKEAVDPTPMTRTPLTKQKAMVLLVVLQALGGCISISNHILRTKKVCIKLSQRAKCLEHRKRAWHSFTGPLWGETRKKKVLAPAVQKQCMFGLTCQSVITGNWTTFENP